MSCRSSNRALVTKDFMGTEENDQLGVSGFGLDKNKEAVSDKGCLKTNLKLAKDMSAIDFFRKYLLDRTQHNKTMINEEKIDNRFLPRALLPPKPGCNLPRPISLLERELLPGRSSMRTENGSICHSPQGAELTIFYGGVVSVFDNVTIEKAQTIMLLAGESSFATPTITKSPKPDRTSTDQPNLPSICKFQASDLPSSRKRSIQSFLAKRRERITQKSPYKNDDYGKKHFDQDDELLRDGGSKTTNRIFHPSPFPSRSGFLFNVPTEGHC